AGVLGGSLGRERSLIRLADRHGIPKQVFSARSNEEIVPAPSLPRWSFYSRDQSIEPRQKARSQDGVKPAACYPCMSANFSK
ncbi:hypothetical protein ABTE34_20400, partial [Acinetobacter baumannii]